MSQEWRDVRSSCCSPFRSCQINRQSTCGNVIIKLNQRQNDKNRHAWPQLLKTDEFDSPINVRNSKMLLKLTCSRHRSSSRNSHQGKNIYIRMIQLTKLQISVGHVADNQGCCGSITSISRICKIETIFLRSLKNRLFKGNYKDTHCPCPTLTA